MMCANALKVQSFSIGMVVISINALEQLATEDWQARLIEHANGNWGQVDPEDRALNSRSLREGGRLISVWTDRQNRNFYIVSDTDRLITFVSLPGEDPNI
jgi:hypothetical protein